MTAKEVGERVKFFREKKNMKKNTLANLARLSPTYINDIESGRKCPTVQSLSYICQGLDISLMDFFEEKGALHKTADNLTADQKERLNEFLKSIT